jgi:hypothetical protein
MMAVLHPKGGGGGTLEKIAVSASFRATAMASASRAATEAFFFEEKRDVVHVGASLSNLLGGLEGTIGAHKTMISSANISSKCRK